MANKVGVIDGWQTATTPLQVIRLDGWFADVSSATGVVFGLLCSKRLDVVSIRGEDFFFC